MANTNTPKQLPAGLGPQGSNEWAEKNGLASFTQLVIGKGVTPTYQPNVTQAAGKRKTVLQNNAMVGQTVGAYYKAAKQIVPGPISTNNPLMAIKHGLITLHLPTKS